MAEQKSFIPPRFVHFNLNRKHARSIKLIKKIGGLDCLPKRCLKKKKIRPPEKR